MNKYFNLLIVLFILFGMGTAQAQNDTLYVLKNGRITVKLNIHTDIDSIVFYKPEINDSFTDERDGRTYRFVEIGNQVWMAENLKYLPAVYSETSGSITEPRYYVYDYNGTNVDDAKESVNFQTYGVLYNWAAAMNGQESSDSQVQGICPTGWHLPTDAEWDELADFVGGAEVAGGKLKEAGLAHWLTPNDGATDEFGFTALPGGARDSYYGGVFYNIQQFGFWWSSTEDVDSDDEDHAWYRTMNYLFPELIRFHFPKAKGLSVRCVQN